LGAETIQVNWASKGITMGRILDTVGFTVYEVSGATNVPGYSAYKYQVWSPVVQYDLTPNVVSVTGGQKQSEFAGGTGGAAGITMQANVLWDAGPLVGKVRVTPGSAVSNFFVDREVNVVKIAFSPGGADNKLVFNNPPFQDATLSARHPVGEFRWWRQGDVRNTQSDAHRRPRGQCGWLPTRCPVHGVWLHSERHHHGEPRGLRQFRDW